MTGNNKEIRDFYLLSTDANGVAVSTANDAADGVQSAGRRTAGPEHDAARTTGYGDAASR